jgi:hypothetical protein
MDAAKRRFSVHFTLTAREAGACGFGIDLDASPCPPGAEKRGLARTPASVE